VVQVQVDKEMLVVLPVPAVVETLEAAVVVKVLLEQVQEVVLVVLVVLVQIIPVLLAQLGVNRAGLVVVVQEDGTFQLHQ
jgi:hypothetical protein